MVDETLKANEILKGQGVDAEIINIHTIKPIDKEAIIKSAKKTGAVLVAENHNVIGGLYSAVCEVLCENCPVVTKSIGIKDVFGQVGKMPYLKKVYEMTAEDIAKKAKECIEFK